ncbi:hypothetical protein, partial [Pseudomonas sp. WS 5406]|uniref:hypothetical protein n=1 Tax=Pseudomonas sp. WS 5406 TaxID=2717498 RepID=UPI001CA3DE22
FAGTKTAIHVGCLIYAQHFPAATGFVTLTDEMTYAHFFASYPCFFSRAFLLVSIRKLTRGAF